MLNYHRTHVILHNNLFILNFTKGNLKNDKDIFPRNESLKIYEIENSPTENQLPKSRTFKSIEINHTSRHFPTPSRESTKVDEQEVRIKQNIN